MAFTCVEPLQDPCTMAGARRECRCGLRCPRLRWGLTVLLFTWPMTAPAEDFCRLGFEALERKDLATAETRLKNCIDSNPPVVAPYLALCGLYQSQGRMSDLHAVALAGLQKFPEERRFYLTVGIQAGREKKYERSIEVLSEGHRRWPDDATLKKNLASAHLLLGMRLLDVAKN